MSNFWGAVQKEPCFSEKRTAAFHEWLVFTKGYGAAKRER